VDHTHVQQPPRLRPFSKKSKQNQLLRLPEKGAFVFVNQSHRLRDSTFAKRKTRFLWTMYTRR